jgi:ubiquinone/menaquinone biosynthesis C-methylase UbiE
MTRYPRPVNPRDAAGWDRSADLKAIRDTYRGYDETNRARLWDESSRGYARLVAEVEGHLVASLAASLPASGGTVLDLGCGEGNLAGVRDSLGTATEWIGLDLRPEAIQVARSRFPDVRFIVASADAVPLEDGSVDVVVARVLFSSLPSARLKAAVAAEIRRLLRSGGWLVWLDIRYGNPRNSAVHGMPTAHIDRLFPGWRRELRSAGLLPPIARRLGAATPLAYRVMSALPPLRSHIVGRLAPPAHGA